jgi:hypothetical protein
MIGVTHHRAEGAAWGQYVAMIVILGGGSEGTTAATGRVIEGSVASAAAEVREVVHGEFRE